MNLKPSYSLFESNRWLQSVRYTRMIFARFLTSPRAIGTLVPSSPYLAHALSQKALPYDFIIELGAGTGAITHTLVQQHAHRAKGLISVEMDAHFCSLLQERFEHLDVQCAAAQQFLNQLEWTHQRTALISALPLRSLPPVVVEQCADSICRFLVRNPQSILVQFTYFPKQPFTLNEHYRQQGFYWSRCGFVWRNAPPAYIWTLQLHQ